LVANTRGLDINCIVVYEVYASNHAGNAPVRSEPASAPKLPVVFAVHALSMFVSLI
jgi:hypothetical protein